MYPTALRWGAFEITSFGLMVALGALAGLWLLQREARRDGLPAAVADAGIWGVLGGLAGAKLLFVAEHLGTEPFLPLLLDRGGMSWFGGAAGGVLAGAIALRRAAVPFLPAFSAAAPGLAAGQALGRVGCFLVGDDYGRPTSLPWGIAFPRGLPPTLVPVHPTQLYEAAFLVGLTGLLLRLRAGGASPHRVTGAYLAAAGFGRFLIELVRVNRRVALDLTVAQWASLAATVAGVALLVLEARGRHSDGGEVPAQ